MSKQLMKRIVQVYKPPHAWKASPPGIGDFLKGTCHLHEIALSRGLELRMDLSQSAFFPLIQFDPEVFQAGDKSQIEQAEELHNVSARDGVLGRIAAFQKSDEQELYLCTNLGKWSRRHFKESTRDFVGRFFRFAPCAAELEDVVKPGEAYVVLHIRAGDHFLKRHDQTIEPALCHQVFALIEHQVIPRTNLPVVVISDCHPLKEALSQRYGFRMCSHFASHSSRGDVLPVARDLCLLRHSSFNFHINARQRWWSGFSHYTSILFGIPTLNFRFPDFFPEEITASGRLIISMRHRVKLTLRNPRANFYFVWMSEAPRLLAQWHR